jgi:hypothetical protein
MIAHLWENLSFPVDSIPNMKTSSWNHLRTQYFSSFSTTTSADLNHNVAYKKAHLSIQVKKVEAFCIENGIRKFSQSTLRNKTRMSTKNQELHYIPQEFLLPENKTKQKDV